MFVGVFLGDSIVALFVTSPVGPGWRRLLVVATAFLPGLILLAAGPLSRFRRFPWTLRWPQPTATIGDLGLEICLPDRGCQRFSWDEIGRLVPTTTSANPGQPAQTLCDVLDGRVTRTYS
jgi:hypothetical protein